MPTILGRPFPPDFTGYPPHMAREDFAIWQRWYPLVQPKPSALYFDVGVGDGRDPGDAATPDERALWLKLTQKRIDALLLFPERVIIVELRHEATSNAIGRLLTYRMLLEQDNPFNLPIQTVLVSDYADPDLPAAAATAAIHYTIA